MDEPCSWWNSWMLAYQTLPFTTTSHLLSSDSKHTSVSAMVTSCSLAGWNRLRRSQLFSNEKIGPHGALNPIISRYCEFPWVVGMIIPDQTWGSKNFFIFREMNQSVATWIVHPKRWKSIWLAQNGHGKLNESNLWIMASRLGKRSSKNAYFKEILFSIAFSNSNFPFCGNLLEILWGHCQVWSVAQPVFHILYGDDWLGFPSTYLRTCFAGQKNARKISFSSLLPPKIHGLFNL